MLETNGAVVSAEPDWRNSQTWYTHETTVVKIVKSGYRVLLSPFITVERQGLENLPANGPCVLASNHVSNFDPTMILSYLRVRHVFYMAKIELFNSAFNRWFFANTGAFPINRSGNDSWALAQAGRILEAGQILGMFPEGTRSKEDGQLKKGKLGTVALALAHQVPIVPVALLNTQHIRLKLRRNRTHVIIRVGPPLNLPELAGPPPYSPNTYRELTAVLMQHIAALLPPEQRGRYG